MYIYCIQNLLLSSDMVVKPNFSMVLGNDLVVNDFRNHNIFGIHYRQYSIALSPCPPSNGLFTNDVTGPGGKGGGGGVGKSESPSFSP